MTDNDTRSGWKAGMSVGTSEARGLGQERACRHGVAGSEMQDKVDLVENKPNQCLAAS